MILTETAGARASVTFQRDLQDKKRVLFLYSATPPRVDTPEDRLQSAAERLARRAGRLHVNGVVIYDIQEEGERTQEERPFPFRPAVESQAYSQRMRGLTPSPLIAYKCIAGMQEWEWERWLSDAEDTGIAAVSAVGLASSHARPEGVTLSRALEIAAKRVPNLALGGVVIPERHIRQNECTRLLRKADLGCRYFISQAIYDPALTINLLQDYARTCKESDVAPQRIFLTFAPCGSEKTLEFMRWLGIHVPEETAQRILNSDAPAAESVRVCVENFERIREALIGSSVPLGVNVESVSARKDESAGAIDLHRALYDLASSGTPGDQYW